MARYQRTPIAFWIIIFIAVCATGLLLFSVREHFASQATMTLYYSPTCPHCVNIMPAWDNFETAVKAQGLALKTSKVNVVDQPDKVPADVNSYPTIILVGSKGKVTYNGTRTTDDMLTFAKTNL